MIEIRCVDCGRLNQLPEDQGGTHAPCAACGRMIEIPRSQFLQRISKAQGIRANEPGIGLSGPDASHSLPGNGIPFKLADAHCRIWRDGEMPSATLPSHTVTEASATGLRVRLGAKAKKKTLVHLQQAPWAVGDAVGVDFLTAAFTAPVRLQARVARTTSLGIGKGSELDLEITGMDEDAEIKLKMLEERPDLRAKVNRELL